jgi:putative heme-binding domain-containing protein
MTQRLIACIMSNMPIRLFLLMALSFAVAVDDATAQAPRPRRQATAPEALQVIKDFKVELLRNAQTNEGSWVAITIDPKGRLIVSPQGKEPMLRVTLGADGQVANLETIDVPVTGAMGLLCAFDSLYVNGRGPDGYQFYRIRDTDGNDRYDSVELLRKWNGNRGGDGEHGAHGIVLGPDNKLYIVLGNFVDVPEDISRISPFQGYADDVLLPRMEDGRGFGAGRKPPGGYVLRVDADGKNAELFAAGERNTYDIAFNPEGELFGFDSDMEWDWGTPWYRPTRVGHIVSGADHGFREGTAKWPTYYPDSLPPTVDIGIGSPTGVKFGTGAKYPAKYQRALYVMDWSYGRIMAVHLKLKGSSYSATFENFVAPRSLTGSAPKATLNVTDLEIGRDGAMYFLTGGRGTQSGLYRVSYEGAVGVDLAGLEQAPAEELSAAAARARRHKLESFHRRKDPSALGVAWDHLDSEDRYIRYAARLALEAQPVESWQQRALDEKRKRASLTALLALARCGGREVQDQLLDSLGRYWPNELDEEQKLEALRVCQLAFIRMGKPGSETARDVINSLNPLYPARSWSLNRELSNLLIYLDAWGVVKKTMDLLAQATTQEEQIHYVLQLRGVKDGWTLDERKAYFAWFSRPRDSRDGGPTYPGGASYFISRSDQHPAQTVHWFKEAGRDYGDGASFPNFLTNLRNAATNSLTPAEYIEVMPLLAAKASSTNKALERVLVKDWKMRDLVGSLEEAGRGRNFRRGKEAFEAAQCLACHRFNNEGGDNGPDLTAVSSRFTRSDLLSSILEPSKVVSEQYLNMNVTKKDGDDVTGRVLEANDARMVLLINPLTGQKLELKKSDVARVEPSKVSAMPEGLVNILTEDEILDLIAYVESGGKRDHAAFRRRGE